MKAGGVEIHIAPVKNQREFIVITYRGEDFGGAVENLVPSPIPKYADFKRFEAFDQVLPILEGRFPHQSGLKIEVMNRVFEFCAKTILVGNGFKDLINHEMVVFHLKGNCEARDLLDGSTVRKPTEPIFHGLDHRVSNKTN